MTPVISSSPERRRRRLRRQAAVFAPWLLAAGLVAGADKSRLWPPNWAGSVSLPGSDHSHARPSGELQQVVHGKLLPGGSNHRDELPGKAVRYPQI